MDNLAIVHFKHTRGNHWKKRWERKQKQNPRDILKKNYYNIIRKFMFINQNYIVFPDAYIKYMWSLTFNIYGNTSLMN